MPITACLLLCLLASLSEAQTITVLYVDDSSTCVNNASCNTSPCAGCNCGGSWTAAFQKLEHAIKCTDNNSSTTEQIWVARGKYTPPNGGLCSTATPGTFCLKNTVHIFGGFVGNEDQLVDRPLDPDPWTIDPSTDSVLTGDRDGNDAIVEPCPVRPDNPTGDCLVECTVPDTCPSCGTNDRLWADTTNTWTNGQCFDGYGLPVTRNTDNANNIVTAPDGTAVDKVTLDGFTITAGNATGNCEPGAQNCNPEAGGGGLRVRGVSAQAGLTARNCAILYNRATNGGGGIYAYGDLNVHIVDSVIAYNRAGHGGGVVGGKGTGGFWVVNGHIVGNVAHTTGGGIHTELIDVGFPAPQLQQYFVNTVVVRNRAGPLPGSSGSSEAGRGGGIYIEDAGVSVSIENCTITQNETLWRGLPTGEGGGLRVTGSAQVQVRNSVIYGNKADAGAQVHVGAIGSNATVDVRYSDVRRRRVCVSSDTDGTPCLSVADCAGPNRRCRDPGLNGAPPSICIGGSKDGWSCNVATDCPGTGATCNVCAGGTRNGLSCQSNCPAGSCPSGSCVGGVDSSKSCCPAGTCLFAQDVHDATTTQRVDTDACVGGSNPGTSCTKASDCDGGICSVRPGNLLNNDPLFVDAPSGVSDVIYDLSLQSTSPCLDAADNRFVPLDTVDLDSDGITDVLPNNAEKVPLDLRRRARFVNGAAGQTGQPDPGPPTYPSPFIVDMGAYEFATPVVCTEDAHCPNIAPWIERCVAGVCVDCLVNDDCPDDADAFDEYCNTQTNRCVECATDGDCDPTGIDPCAERCVDGKCLDDFRVLADTGGIPRRNRYLSFSVTHPGPVALRILMLDLHHPVPKYPTPPTCPNPPVADFHCNPRGSPANLSSFDLDLNSVCGGGASGFHCHSNSDCRACIAGSPRVGQYCASDKDCGQCSNFGVLTCTTAAECAGTCLIPTTGICSNSMCSDGPRMDQPCTNDNDCRHCSNNSKQSCTTDTECSGDCTNITGSCSDAGTLPCGTPVACTAVGEAVPPDAQKRGGCARWVGKPATFNENDGPSGGTFRGALLQCAPVYHDWSVEGVIHVTGAEIVPSSDYAIQIVPPDTDTASPCGVGAAGGCRTVGCSIYAQTARWGDAAADFAPPATIPQPNSVDITEIVNKFRGLSGAPIKATAQMQPLVPRLSWTVDALDVVSVVDAFRGFHYPYEAPCPCPSPVACSHQCVGPTDCKLCEGGTTPGAWCDDENQCPGVGATCGGLGGSSSLGLCVKTCTGGGADGFPCSRAIDCPGGTCGSASCRDRCGRCN
jgi:hypothetical protein